MTKVVEKQQFDTVKYVCVYTYVYKYTYYRYRFTVICTVQEVSRKYPQNAEMFKVFAGWWSVSRVHPDLVDFPNQGRLT